MAKITGAVNVTGIIAPTDTDDIYAVVDPRYGVDGLRNVDTLGDMYAIPPDRRRLGMLVGVGVSGTSGTYYSLTNNPGSATTTLSDWTVFTSGSGGTGGISGVEIEDEGIPVGTYTIINFVGDDVLAQDSGQPNKVNVYIPTPSFSSHFNTTDGTTTGTVSRTLTVYNLRISNPTTEGNPFKTGGWAGTNQSTTIQTTPSFSTGGTVTGFSANAGGDATITVTVYDADGVSVLASYTTPTLYQNAVHNNGAGIIVTITSYAADAFKWKAQVAVSINMATIFGSYGLSGGKYGIKIEMHTDTATDGGGNYVYGGGANAVFLDTNGTTPSISGAMTLVESTNPSNILTKHLSGVEYYILNSQFETTVTDVNNLNQNTQGAAFSTSYNFQISASEYGLPTRSLQAWSLAYGTWSGTWTNFWNLTGSDFTYLTWPITATNYRYRGSSANGSSQAFDPFGSSNVVNSPNASILIDTVGANSTNLGEDFDDEAERLIRNVGTSSYDPWVSTATLSNGEACVVDSYLIRADKYYLSDSTVQPNLTTFKPNKGGSNPNYTGFSANAVYHRKFYTASSKPIASFDMVFGGNLGTSGNATAALIASNLKIYIRRVAIPAGGTGTYGFNANPLALHGGDFDSGAPANPYNDGASGIDTPGSFIRTGASSGNTVKGTFGGDNALTGFWAEIVIVDSTIKIDYVNVTLRFTDGTTDSNPV